MRLWLHSQTTKQQISCINHRMEKKVDNRIEGTLQRIREAYLKEKRKKSISEIKIIDICKNANINKSTFYRHYRDIYDLADIIENSVIDEIHSKINHLSHLLTDPEAYINDSMGAFKEQRELLSLVFDSRMDLLISKIERGLVEHYISENHSRYEELLIKFCVGGASRIITGSLSEAESKESTEFLINMIKKMNQ